MQFNDETDTSTAAPAASAPAAETPDACRRTLLKASAAAPVVATLFSGAAVAQTSAMCETKFAATNPDNSVSSPAPMSDRAVRATVNCYTPLKGGPEVWDDGVDVSVVYDAMGNVYDADDLKVHKDKYYTTNQCDVLVYHDIDGMVTGLFPRDVNNGGLALSASCQTSLLNASTTI